MFINLFVAVTRFGTPSSNIPTADVEPIIRPDLLPSVMANPSKLEVLYEIITKKKDVVYRNTSKDSIFSFNDAGKADKMPGRERRSGTALQETHAVYRQCSGGMQVLLLQRNNLFYNRLVVKVSLARLNLGEKESARRLLHVVI